MSRNGSPSVGFGVSPVTGRQGRIGTEFAYRFQPLRAFLAGTGRAGNYPHHKETRIADNQTLKFIRMTTSLSRTRWMDRAICRLFSGFRNGRVISLNANRHHKIQHRRTLRPGRALSCVDGPFDARVNPGEFGRYGMRSCVRPLCAVGWPLALMKSARQVPLRAPGSSAHTKPRVFLVAAPLIIITYVSPYSDMWRRSSSAIRWRSYAALGAR